MGASKVAAAKKPEASSPGFRWFRTEPWMRPPAWRMLAALALSHDTNVQVSTVRSFDVAVARLVEYYRDTASLQDTALLVQHRDVLNALDIFFNVHEEQWRWFIEAMIVGGASDAEIGRQTTPTVRAPVIKMYRLGFFDVTSYTDKPSQIRCNVLATSRGDDAFRITSDLLWKEIAWQVGWQKFLVYHQRRVMSEVDGETWEDLFADVQKCVNRLMKLMSTESMYMQVAQARKTFTEQTLATLSTARSMLVQDGVAGHAPDAAGDEGAPGSARLNKATGEMYDALLGNTTLTILKAEARLSGMEALPVWDYANLLPQAKAEIAQEATGGLAE